MVSNYGMKYKEYTNSYSYCYSIKMNMKTKISNIKNMMNNNWKIKMNMNMRVNMEAKEIMKYKMKLNNSKISRKMNKINKFINN
jgi:hypothetical protein